MQVLTRSMYILAIDGVKKKVYSDQSILNNLAINLSSIISQLYKKRHLEIQVGIGVILYQGFAPVVLVSRKVCWFLISPYQQPAPWAVGCSVKRSRIAKPHVSEESNR